MSRKKKSGRNKKVYMSNVHFQEMIHLLKGIGMSQINGRLEKFRMKEVGKKPPKDASYYTRKRMEEVEGQVIFEKHYGFDYCLRVMTTFIPLNSGITRKGAFSQKGTLFVAIVTPNIKALEKSESGNIIITDAVFMVQVRRDRDALHIFLPKLLSYLDGVMNKRPFSRKYNVLKRLAENDFKELYWYVPKKNKDSEVLKQPAQKPEPNSSVAEYFYDLKRNRENAKPDRIKNRDRRRKASFSDLDHFSEKVG